MEMRFEKVRLLDLRRFCRIVEEIEHVSSPAKNLGEVAARINKAHPELYVVNISHFLLVMKRNLETRANLIESTSGRGRGDIRVTAAGKKLFEFARSVEAALSLAEAKDSLTIA